MRTTINASGREEIVFLSQTDKEILIYLNTDVWITPELKRFKKGILERLEENNPVN